ncbi:TRAP transporter substrate-binding protein DctP [Halodesulfovibrio sp.]|jgi:TRAP-type C4-dicarboxylate transport system substrate-binding protein|uniref:TRAP transporter substrate-binding protein DctP n=1 Tax=Halodesulfovibrio sp. TaxID=1912772 RepID=UPI0025CE2499|nr:TRAP transporter substrate-binding protein DctP [Halodesulfovibrio sp.]MCT4534353.1 TRAP transporter substrate-binding protein DctP [Halodesulfovibrio sp.]MCT4625754.1 TRAP transporter substrate-binding protein DctP [Halodesulfovibrio sp.]
MKRIVALMLCFAFAFGLTVGINGDAQAVMKKNGKVILSLATQHPTEHMAHKSAERIKARIEKETNGRVEIKIYPANQLGDASQLYEEVIRGSIDIAHITVPDQFDARLGVGFLPFIARDYEQARKVYDRNAFLPKEMAKMHDALGVKFLGYYGEGFIGVGTVKPLQNANKPGVEKGFMIRVPGLDVFKFGAEELGFRTSSLPYTDTYSALQTGVVDGWLGGPPNLNYLGFRDVIKEYYQYNVNFESTQYVMNKRLFAGMSAEDQKIIESAFGDESQNSFLMAESEDEMYRKKLAEEGIKVIMFTTQELEQMADYVRAKAWPRLEKNLTPELLNGIKESYKN